MNWRLGDFPYDVFEGNRPICQTHTAVDARRIVAAVNSKDGADILQQILEAVQGRAEIVEVWNRALDAFFASLPVSAFFSRSTIMEKLNDLKTDGVMQLPIGPPIIQPGSVRVGDILIEQPQLTEEQVAELQPTQQDAENAFARGIARDMARKHNERQQPEAVEPAPVPLKEYCSHPACYAEPKHEGPHIDVNGAPMSEEEAKAAELAVPEQVFCHHPGCYAKPAHDGPHTGIDGKTLAKQTAPEEDIPF